MTIANIDFFNTVIDIAPSVYTYYVANRLNYKSAI